MIIVTENTEEKLARLLDAIKNKTAGIRCVHLQLSKFEGKTPEPQKLAGIINSIIKSDDTRIMFCEDRDVLIIASSISIELFEKLQLHIATFLGVTSSNISMDLYELSKDWSVVSILCEDKLKKQEATKQEVQKKLDNTKTEQKQNSILNINIEDELIKSFIAKRKNRKQAEILVVEDDMFSRKLVISTLSKEYTVSGAKDGKEAIQQYALHGPDVMFLDIELPDVTGHEVLRKILSFDPDAYIIMLSGKGDKDNVLQAMKEGAKGFVGKPFAKEKLLQYINKCPTIS